MSNKFKIAAVVVAVIVGMVLYKEHHDRKEREKEANDANKNSGRANNRWN